MAEEKYHSKKVSSKGRIVAQPEPGSYFRRYGNLLTLFDQDGKELLRPPQLALARASLAHFTRSDTPAIGALPTGVGKTGAIAVLPYLLPARRLLIVVPNRLLREQLAQEMLEMTLLRRLGVLRPDIPSPLVAVIEHEIHNHDDWATYEQYDVVIATPYCISPAVSSVKGPPKDLFDLLIFDEAHHTPAPTWMALLDGLQSCRCAMLTATPYRRDRDPLPGSLIYDYPMRRALAEDYISPLTRKLVAFDTAGDPDVALIHEVQELTKPGATYNGVPFLVRTASKEHARSLTKLYASEGLEVGLLLGEHSLRYAKRLVDRFRNRQVSGLIIVGVLGEGFDFPDVKLGAYHRRHKSLAPTLQFLGRLARKSANPVPALVLVPQHIVHDETAALYEENAEWSDLIPDLADQAVTLEINEAATRAAFGDLTDETIAPHALTPARVVSVFQVEDTDSITLSRTALPAEVQNRVFQWFEPKGNDKRFIAWLSAELQPPRWARGTALNERLLAFNAAVYIPAAQMLVIAGEKGYEVHTIAEAFGIKNPAPVNPEKVQGYLKELGVQSYYNVGMRSVEAPSNMRPTYRQSTGPSIDANAILPAERQGYAFGHGTARITGESGPESLGVALRSGRFWSQQSADSLASFVEWCRTLAVGLRSALAQTSAPNLDLRRQVHVQAFPDNPVFVELDPFIAARGVSLNHSGKSFRLDVLEYKILASSANQTEIGVFSDGASVASIFLDRTGSATFRSAGTLRSADSVDALDGADLFTRHPITIYYSDGSSVHGPLLVPAQQYVVEFPPTQIEILDWSRVDIRREKVGRNGLLSIHQFMAAHLQQAFPKSLVINDDDPDEIADLIVFQRYSHRSVVRLYHCKGATGAGANLQDLYEVLGQAQRSARWSNAPAFFWEEAAERIRTRFKVESGDLKGATEYLDACVSSGPATHFEISIVQPGLNAAILQPGDNMNVVLSMTDNVIRSHNATFNVFAADRNVQRR